MNLSRAAVLAHKKAGLLERNISHTFRPSEYDSQVAAQLLKHEGTHYGLEYFRATHKGLTSYSYWFLLSTLWISYTGHTDIAVWRELFSSPRKGREEGLMKPDELRAFRKLPDPLMLYRAHRVGEWDWLSYTTDPQVAATFALRKGMDAIYEYTAPRSAAMALFLRRGEEEILLPDLQAVSLVRKIAVIVGGES